jgi:hypothetical protein
VEGGWSVKDLHRLMVLSHAYRQASADNPAAAGLDPENTLLWKINRRRLDVESLRDAVLAASGALDPTLGGPPVELTVARPTGRRTVYGVVDRHRLSGLLRAFDFASPEATTAQRHETTVPQQALFLLNSPFMSEQARRLARRAALRSGGGPRERVEQLYRLVYGRAADAEEVRLGLRFLAEEGRPGDEPGPGAAEGGLGPWERYALALLLANEFTFLD